MSTEYKAKNEIPDLYHILGLTIDVCKQSDCDEQIAKAYHQKTKNCHPDKYPGRKDVAELFLLLTSTYDILRDEKQRNTYNHKLSLVKQSSNDFLKLKKQTQEHMESIGQYTPATKEQEVAFEQQMRIVDEKHGFDRSSQKVVIPKHETKRKIQEIANIRANQDFELKPKRLFEEGEIFNGAAFNALFDKYHQRDEGTVTLHNGIPAAWNDLGTVANFSDFDDLNNVYVEDTKRVDIGRDTYSNINFGTVPSNLPSKEDLVGLEGASYYKGHSMLGEDYYSEMKKKLKERKGEASSFETMKYGDFKKDDFAGYGIHDQIGINITDRITLDDDEDDIKQRLEKIIYERQQDIPLGNNTIDSKFNNTTTKSNKNYR